MSRLAVAVALVGLLAGVAGCSSACKPGEVSDCSCSAGGTGTQTCQADGTFDACGRCQLVCGDLDCGRTTGNVTRITCDNDTCGYEACLDGFSDCDGNPVNGCETMLATRCANMNATGVFCADDACDYQSCVAGQNDCDGDRANGCEYLGSSCPEAVVTGQSRVIAIAVDADNVYWTRRDDADGGGEVMELPKAGGSPIVLASGQGSALSIAVDDGSVFWSNGNALMRVSKAGGAPVQLATSDGRITGQLAFDATAVYWTADAQGSVMTVPIDGGAAVTLASNQFEAQGTAVDGSYVYWTYQLGDLMKIAKDGGTPIQIGTSSGGDDSLVADSSTIYVASYDGDEVLAFDKQSGTRRTLASGEIGATSIAVDDAWVYWSVTNGTAGTGRVMKVPLDGGTPIPLATMQDSPFGVVIDDQYVYWTAYPDDTIWRALK